MCRRGATEPEKPKPDDLYELYNPAMVELRAALDEYWSSADAENEKREKRERETVKSSGTTGKIPDGSREKFPIDDRLTNGHNEA